MKTVWICTPAHGRLDLSGVCFAQHQNVATALRPRGIEVVSCVAACDENLELAESLGAATIEMPNDYLGQRFNSCYEFAAAEGADFICPLGSDSWIHPSFFDALGDPAETVLLTSSRYALVDEAGERFAKLSITLPPGVGPHVFPTRLLAESDWRPVGEQLQRGCDHSLLTAIGRSHELEMRWRDFHSAQYIGFRTQGEQLNPYEQLASRYATSETTDPWAELADAGYPPNLITAARDVYAARAVAV